MASNSLPRKRVGLIGVGNISPAYIKGCRMFDVLDLAACADIDVERAKRVAAENGIPHAYSVDELLADPSIDIVVNLTVPVVHAEISQRIIAAGKHVYSEKPLSITLKDAKGVIDAAQAKGVRVGCAPDTFLFGPHQNCRRAVDSGVIGKIVGAAAFFVGHGPERWHPNPDFFYKFGGGPMLDVGTYPITNLVSLIGPVVRVSGTATASVKERIGQNDRRIPVEVPTHYTGVLEFASGAVATLIVSFDVWKHRLPAGMDLYGELGTLTAPDPNGHQPRDVKLYKPGQDDWVEIKSEFPDEWMRGTGVADMAHAILENRPHRASGELAYHVLEIMEAFELAQREGKYVTLKSTCTRPEPLTPDFGKARA